MIILGITNNDLAGACLVRDGGIVAAASEERFTRQKDHKAWPSRSIDYVLGEAGIDLADIDRIAYGWNAGFDAGRHLDLYLDRVLEEARERPEGLPHLRKRIADEMANDKAKRGEFDAFVRANGLRGKVEYIDHHECHALGAFVCSPFDEALTLTCDGRGDFQSLTVTHYRADGGEAVLQRETSVDSLGYFYGRITHLLGFKPNRHEGKITGLAAFGDAEKLLPLMNDMIRLENGRLRARCGELYLPSYDGYSDPLLQRCAAERPADVAAAAQRHSEDLLVAIAREHVARTGCANLCLAGGVFGNVKLNQRLREIPGVRDVYVLPCMGDGGLALAAAVAVAYRENGTRFPAPSMALGPDARSAAQNAELIASQYPQLAYSRPANLIETLVEALRENQVLGMFKGRMEFGPRALCNRSIVYHPGDASANDWLNQRMERTEFMPFAPVTAVEHAEACYVGWREDQVAADYMTMTYDCHADFRERCPAVVHVDGTARPQIIRPQADPFMHALLHAWHARSGQPALINTSFNRHEEPIVCAPQDALGALEDGMVDLVVLGESLLVWRKGENAFARARFE
ncbi:carbamoyltransferase [Pseudomonas aeruginosa]|uniref:carbamoyltransferase family protein n=1 Tax=Pseudomonas aeruginosa TaxID=287 RepID=UPI000EB609DE|nr:carbamoyltransferase [Pseudomonas aeruginosa]MCO2404684.1 carbamoyl transferase [Pseudomonas aeruginosa]MCO2639540.1 carbamoyl transferase [Pseudomonas aeruginosa]MCO2676341.1 carbamoyl transferase [Pseudomonas aeruginosa]MCO2794605.1 carbamoyl transferase [Pseudomonas aeruginosa]MCO3210776.1 carbamoyl transferase [Pseudomonas aeruginosa]